MLITKHWQRASDDILGLFIQQGIYLNTSVSPLDTQEQREYRVEQFDRYLRAGGRSILRVVTVDPVLENPEGASLAGIQDELLKITPHIDNPLRAHLNSPLVVAGVIRLHRATIHSGRGSYVSLHSPDIYLGACDKCPDLCGLALYPGAGE